LSRAERQTFAAGSQARSFKRPVASLDRTERGTGEGGVDRLKQMSFLHCELPAAGDIARDQRFDEVGVKQLPGNEQLTETCLRRQLADNGYQPPQASTPAQAPRASHR
jgi:hypothetical protein